MSALTSAGGCAAAALLTVFLLGVGYTPLAMGYKIKGTTRKPAVNPVQEGADVELKVFLDKDWKYCNWYFGEVNACSQISDTSDGGGHFGCGGAKFPGFVGGDFGVKDACALRMPGVTHHSTGEWKAQVIFTNGSKTLKNVTTKFHLLTTREADINFVGLNESLKVAASHEFRLTCQALNGQPIPTGFSWSVADHHIEDWSPCYSNLILPASNWSIYSAHTNVSQTIRLTPPEVGNFTLTCSAIQHTDTTLPCTGNCTRSIVIEVTPKGGGGGGDSVAGLSWYWTAGLITMAVLAVVLIVVVLVVWRFTDLCKPKVPSDKSTGKHQSAVIHGPSVRGGVSQGLETSARSGSAAVLPHGLPLEPRNYSYFATSPSAMRYSGADGTLRRQDTSLDSSTSARVDELLRSTSVNMGYRANRVKPEAIYSDPKPRPPQDASKEQRLTVQPSVAANGTGDDAMSSGSSSFFDFRRNNRASAFSSYPPKKDTLV